MAVGKNDRKPEKLQLDKEAGVAFGSGVEKIKAYNRYARELFDSNEFAIDCPLPADGPPAATAPVEPSTQGEAPVEHHVKYDTASNIICVALLVMTSAAIYFLGAAIYKGFTSMSTVVMTGPAGTIGAAADPWQAASLEPFATHTNLDSIRCYIITECRDDLHVAKVEYKYSGDVKYVHLRPVAYMSFKLHMNEAKSDSDKTICQATTGDLFVYWNWLRDHSAEFNDPRFFAMASELPVLTGKEIYDIYHPSYIIGWDDAAQVIHFLHGETYEERFIRVDERWYAMFKSEMKDGERYVLGVYNAFYSKYGYEAASSNEPYAAPPDNWEILSGEVAELADGIKRGTLTREELERASDKLAKRHRALVENEKNQAEAKSEADSKQWLENANRLDAQISELSDKWIQTGKELDSYKEAVKLYSQQNGKQADEIEKLRNENAELQKQLKDLKNKKPKKKFIL